MSDVQQLRDDLRYVQAAVKRRERTDTGPASILYVWAVYVIIGYTLMDMRPALAGPFFGIGGFIGGALSWWLGRSYSSKSGEWDRATTVKSMLHFGGGIVLAMCATVSLASIIAPLRSTQGSQVFVVMIGLVYFLWGVHYQRYFMFLGVVVMAGAVVVGLIPHFGWTILGTVISLGLILPTFMPGRHVPAEAPHTPSAKAA